MTRFEKLLTKLKELSLPKKEYVIFGSGPIAVRGLRDSTDLDILATKKLWEELKQKYGSKDGKKIMIGDIEIFKDWKPWLDNEEQIIKEAEIIGSLPYAKLTYVMEWKQKMNREKDQEDIKKIKPLIN